MNMKIKYQHEITGNEKTVVYLRKTKREIDSLVKNQAKLRWFVLMSFVISPLEYNGCIPY